MNDENQLMDNVISKKDEVKKGDIKINPSKEIHKEWLPTHEQNMWGEVVD